MSYILEALEKMERQRVKHQGSGSWVNDLIKGTGKDSSTGGNRTRLAVACLVFFCLIGISAGLLIINRDNISKIEGNTTIYAKADTAVRNIAQRKPVQNLEKKLTPESMADKENLKESLPAKNVDIAVATETPNILPMNKATDIDNIPQQKSMTESDKNSSSAGIKTDNDNQKHAAPVENIKLAVAKRQPDVDKYIPQRESVKESANNSLSIPTTDKEVPESIAPAKSVKLSAVVQQSSQASVQKKTDTAVTESSPASPEVRKPVDLTERYKLSSTGKNDGGPYATIEGTAYNIGDRFGDLIITKIEKDRVYLKQKKNGQSYVIVFRYKR